MTRQKLKLAFIANAAKRKAVCKKRKKGLMKKMVELTTLCDVDACAVIHSSELNSQPEFWPNKSEAERVVEEFKSLPQRQQTNRMYDQRKFMRKRIAKAKKDLQKVQRANREMELTNVMFDCLAGRSGFENLGLEDLDSLQRVVDQKLYDIEKRMESLSLHHPDQVGASTSNVGAMAGPRGDD